MSYTETIAEHGDYRARIEIEEGASNPREEYDYHMCGVVTLYAGRYINVADPAGDDRVNAAWSRLLNSDRYRWDEAGDILARYIRILGGVSEYDTPNDGPASLWYVMPERWTEMTESEWDADKARAAMRDERMEYRSWGEGDVWGVVIEKKTVWVPKGHPDAPEEMQTWEVEDSMWGLIGRERAETEAAFILSEYTKHKTGECECAPSTNHGEF